MDIEEAPKTHKKSYWTIGIIITLVILGLAANIAFKVYFSPLVEKFTRQEVYKASKGLYVVDSMDVEWDVLNSGLVIHNFRLKSDSLKRLDSIDQSIQSPVVDVFIPRIEVEKFHLLDFYRDKFLKIAALNIQKPTIILSQIGNGIQEKNNDTVSSSWQQYIPSSIQALDIDLVSVEDGTIEFSAQSDSSNHVLGVKKLNVSVDNIYFDSTTNSATSSLSIIDDLQASGEMTDYPIFLDGFLHQCQLGNFEFRASDQNVKINNIKLAPIFPSISIDSLVPISIEVDVPEVQFSGINLEELLAKRVRLSKVHIKRPSIQHSLPEFSSKDSAQAPFTLPLIEKLGITEIYIEGGNYRIHPTLEDSIPVVSFKGFNLSSTDLSLEENAITSEEILSILANVKVQVDTINTKIEGANYELLGEDLTLEADSGNIRCSQVRLFSTNKSEKNNVNLRVPDLFISGIDIQRLIQEQQLFVQDLEIASPQVELFQYWSNADSQLVAQWAELDGYHLISGFLDELSINRFKIKEGRLEVFQPQTHHESTFHAKDISLDIQQFKISPYTHHLMEAPFYATNLDLDFDIEGSSIILPDSSYSLSASSISFSTQDSTISADSILLLPLYPDSLTHLAQRERGKIFLGIPQIRFKGLDFYQAYFQREVFLDSLWIRNPNIQWKSALNDNSTQWSLANSLDSLNIYQMVKPYIQKLDIGHFTFEKAAISRELDPEIENSTEFYPITSIFLDHLLIDSVNQTMNNRLLYAENMTIQLENVERILPDSSHRLFVQNITYQTSNKHITIDTLFLTPNTRSNDEKQNLYDVMIPQIRINGLELLEVYREKHLSLSDVQIIDPVFSLINHPEVVKQEIDSLAQADLYDFISDYLHYLEVENLVLNKGEVFLRNWGQKQENAFHADDLFVFIKDFKIDSTSWMNPTNRFYAKDIDIGMDANNYSFALPDSTYLLRIGNIGMSTEDSMFVAQKVKLIPLENQIIQRDPDLLWEIEVPHFQVKGFEPAQWYFNKIARLKHVRILQPKIRMEHLKISSPVEHDPMKVYNFISQQFQDLYINDLFIEGASIEETRLPGDTVKPIIIKGLSLRALNVSPDSSDFLSPDRLFYSNNVRISIKDYSVNVPELDYQLDFGELGMHTASNQLYAKDLRFFPKLGIEDFFRKYKFTRDSLNCYIPDVKVEGVDLDALMHEQDLIANHVVFQGLQLGVKKDKAFPENPNKRPPMVQEIIRNFPLHLKLDTITIANGNIAFAQHVPNLKKEATFSMDNLYADLYNITNDSILLLRNPVAVLKAESRFLETGHVSVNFEIPLADTANQYTFSGKIGRMKFTEFNPLLEQTAFVSVNDGFIHNGTFEVEAIQRQRKKKKEYIYKGKMRLRYSDLKLTVIDKKAMFEKDEYDEKKMASFLANTFVRSNNPKGRGRFLRIGKIYYEKEDDKAMIGHWVQSLISGIRSSVGLENKDERERIILPSFGKKSKKVKKKKQK